MAREEVDREDLLREATALVERAELHVEGFAEPIFIGFRRDGCGSVYFGADPAWHFNTRLELRRAFVDGRLIKAESGRLAALERRRTEREVQLVRSNLSDEQMQAMLARVRNALDQLQTSLANVENHTLVGQSPAGVDILRRIRDWLTALPRDLVAASSPHAR
ncbi:MAG: hypothetical protein RIC55_05710 [Pirellulaceae bacterium]